MSKNSETSFLPPLLGHRSEAIWVCTYCWNTHSVNTNTVPEKESWALLNSATLILLGLTMFWSVQVHSRKINIALRKLELVHSVILVAFRTLQKSLI